MVREGGASHNPHFYCLLTGFPATQAALSGIALCAVSHREDDIKMISPLDGNYSEELEVWWPLWGLTSCWRAGDPSGLLTLSFALRSVRWARHF